MTNWEEHLARNAKRIRKALKIFVLVLIVFWGFYSIYTIAELYCPHEGITEFEEELLTKQYESSYTGIENIDVGTIAGGSIILDMGDRIEFIRADKDE